MFSVYEMFIVSLVLKYTIKCLYTYTIIFSRYFCTFIRLTYTLDVKLIPNIKSQKRSIQQIKLTTNDRAISKQKRLPHPSTMYYWSFDLGLIQIKDGGKSRMVNYKILLLKHKRGNYQRLLAFLKP